jgi:hypothetical protein
MIFSSISCLIWSLFFIVRASLGHAAHPFLSTWKQSLAGVILFILVPAGFLLWFYIRKKEN